MIEIYMTCYNPWDITKKSLDSLFKHTKDFRLTIIDHQSTDETWSELRKLQDKYPKTITLIQRPPESPVCWAWNLAIMSSKSTKVVITANDIIFSKNWLESLLEGFNKGKYIYLQPYNTLSAIPENFPNNYKKEDKIGKVPHHNMIGCCFAIDKSNLQFMFEKEFGKEPYPAMFDESFYPYWYDDYDYAYRLQKIGMPMRTVFNSYVHHYSGAGISKTPSEENIKIKEKNEAYLKKKHNNKQNLDDTKTKNE